MSKNSYIQNSVEVMSQIDPAELAELVPTDLNQESGGTRTFIPIGSLSVRGAQLHMGLKVGQSDFDKETIPYIFKDELVDASFIEKISPDIAHKLPSFMGLVKFGDHPPVILTEDATMGMVQAEQKALSPSSQRALELSLPSGVELDKRVMEHGMAFDVADEERILDLHPSPFIRPQGDRAMFRRYDMLASNKMGDLTINIPHDSPLAVAVRTDDPISV